MTRHQLTFSNKSTIALLVFTAAVVALYLMRPISDPDFFWHLKTGQWILQHKTLPGVDPFSLSPPPADNLRSSFILTSYWLAQIIYAALYALGGWWGIFLVRIALAGIMAVLFASRCDLRQPANVGILLLGAVQMFEVYPFDRPQIFSFTCFMALLVLLDRYRDRDESQKPVVFAILAALLMLVWANLHGGFFVGQVTLILFLVMEGAKFIHPSLSPLTRQRYMGLVMIVAAGLSASFLNPNPVNSLKLLVDIGSSNTFLYTTNIEYFSSLRILREFKDYTIILNWFTMALVAGCALASIRRADITLIALLAGCAYMGCQHVRYMPFFLVTALLYLGKNRCGGTVIKTLCVSTALIASLWFVRDEMRNSTTLVHGRWGVDQTFPVRAADFAAQRNLHGPVYNTFLWGGYLVWRLGGPERKIFCDGRQLDPLRYWEYLNSTAVAQTGTPYWKSMFDKHGIQTAIVQLTDPANGQMNPLMVSMTVDKEWAMVFAKDNAAVFVRR